MVITQLLASAMGGNFYNLHFIVYYIFTYSSHILFLG